MIFENSPIIKIEYFKINSAIKPKKWAIGENIAKIPVKKVTSIALGTNGKINIFANIDITLTAPKVKIISGSVTIWALKVSKNSFRAEFSFSGFSKNIFCNSGERIKTPKNEANDNCQPRLSKFEGSNIKVIAATRVRRKYAWVFLPKYHKIKPKIATIPARIIDGVNPTTKTNPKTSKIATNRAIFLEILLKTRWAAITKTVKLYPLATTMCVKAVIVKALEISSGKEFFWPKR